MSEEKNLTQDNKVKNKGHKIKNAILGILLAVIALYLGIGIYFQSHFLWNTAIDGENVSLKSCTRAEEILEEKGNNYLLLLNEKEEESEVLDLSHINLQVKVKDDIKEKIKTQNAFLWFLAFTKEQNFESTYDITYDQDAFEKEISNLDCLKADHIVKSSNAKIVYDKGYSIKKEEYGNEIDQDKLHTAVKEAMEKLSPSISLEDTGCYIDPKILSDNEKLIKKLEIYQKYEKTKYTYEFGIDTENLTCDTFHDWIKVNKKMKVEVDKDAVAEYVVSLAEKYNTVDTDRKFKSTNAGTVNVHGQYFGYRIDQEEETEALYNALVKNQTFDREPEYAQTGFGRGINDIGDTYIEINLSSQHLYCYIDGEKVYETGIVTGNPNKGNATPPGLFTIKYMASPANLTGATWDSTVQYWMPFNGNIGMHDATWQSSFGGDRYLTHGSHGCVNLPYSAAEYIYHHFSSGTPVVCYKN